MEETMQKLENFLTLLVKTAGFSLKTIETRKDGPDIVKIEVFIEGAGLMIGENGENIFAWEEVLGQWLRRHSEIFSRAVLDINNYRWQIEQRLKELAKKAAREAVLLKKPVKLPVMSNYERRIIHTELALHPSVTTESEGKPPNRQVVVKPL